MVFNARMVKKSVLIRMLACLSVLMVSLLEHVFLALLHVNCAVKAT